MLHACLCNSSALLESIDLQLTHYCTIYCRCLQSGLILAFKIKGWIQRVQLSSSPDSQKLWRIIWSIWFSLPINRLVYTLSIELSSLLKLKPVTVQGKLCITSLYAYVGVFVWSLNCTVYTLLLSSKSSGEMINCYEFYFHTLFQLTYYTWSTWWVYNIDSVVKIMLSF